MNKLILIEQYNRIKNFENCFNLGLFYFNEGKYPESLKLIEESLEQNKDSAEALLQKAICIYVIDKKNEQEARLILEQVFSINPELKNNFYLGDPLLNK
jgi:tetratricopeptide (TPR) repeat protein